MAIKTHDPAAGFEFRQGPQRVNDKGFMESRNADMFPLGAVQKRTGYRRAQPLLCDDDSVLPGTLQGVGYLRDSLLRIQRDDIYGYLPTADRWNKLGAWPTVVTNEPTRLTRAESLFTSDFAELNGYRALVWVETPRINPDETPVAFEVWWASETTDGVSLTPPTMLARDELNQLLQPRAINCGNWIALTYWTADTGEISVHRFQAEFPKVLSAPVTHESDKTYGLLGVPDRTQLWIARSLSGSGEAKLTELRPDLSTDRDRVLPPPITDGTFSLDRWAPTQEIVVAWIDTAEIARAEWLLDDLTPVQTFVVGILARRVTVAIIDSTTAHGFWETKIGPAFGIHRRVLDRTTGGFLPTVQINEGRSLGLAGAALAIDGESYVLGIFVNDTEEEGDIPFVFGDGSDSAYFCLRGRDLAVVSRSWIQGQARQWGGDPGTAAEFLLQSAVRRANGWAWPVTARTLFRDRTPGSPRPFDPSGSVVQAEIDHDIEAARAKTTEANGVAVWALGGYLRGCDDARSWSVDYHLPPKLLDDTVSAGGNMIIGTFIYAVGYMWRDKQGRRYRGLLAFRTVDQTFVDGQVGLETRCLRVAERDDIQLEIWRTPEVTAGLGTALYLVSTPGIPVLNSLTAPTVNFTEGISDADLVTNEVNEQQPAGARLPFDAVQMTAFAAQVGDRVWARSPVTPCRAYASQLPVEREGIHLSAQLFVELDTEEVVAGVADQDGTYFGLSETTVSIWAGRGPENNGEGQAWPPTRAIPTMEGMSLLGGIARAGAHLVYITSDGPVSLLRDQTAGGPTSPIAELYAFTEQTVTDLVYVGQANEFWIFDAGDRLQDPERGTLSFSSQTKRWTQHTQLQAVGGAGSQRGAFAIARTDNLVIIRDPTVYSTANVVTSMTLTPAWQRPQGNMLAPYSIQAIGLVLIWFSEHRLIIDILADDDLANVIATVTVDPDRDGVRTKVEWGDVDPVATWAADSSVRWGSPVKPGSRYAVKLQLGGAHSNSITCRMRDSDGSGQAWGYVQMVTSWQARRANDSLDVLADTELTYTLTTV